MTPISRSRTTVVVLLSAVLSLVWVSGAHLHLCFDGLEELASLHHLADGDDHHHGSEGEHTDADVEIDVTLCKAPKKGADAPSVVASSVHVCACLSATTSLRAKNAPATLHTALRYSRPPLRAPPA